MQEFHIPDWLGWARQIQAIAQSGRMYALNGFQVERYDALSALAAEILAAHSGAPAAAIAASFAEQQGYATPKVDVRAAVVDSQGRLLMVEDRSDATWSLPGGWAEVGDVPSQAAERETLEEAGFHVRAFRLLGVYDANRHPTALHLYHAYKIVFQCELLGGEERLTNETSAVRFFGLSEIPYDRLGSRTTRRQIDDAFAALTDPSCPAQFD